MAPIEKSDRGDRVANVDAEMSRADRRRMIIDAVEKRLSDLPGGNFLAKTGDSKEAKRRKPSRLQGFYRQ